MNIRPSLAATMPRGGRQLMRRVSTVIIGAGHNGLAISHCLTQQGIDHVILERGEIANTWRTERWDSLKLLTPNWQCRLPGQTCQSQQAEEFMPVGQLVDFISTYADNIDAPVHTGCEVTSAAPQEDGYRIISNRGTWHCRSVVIASGAFNTPVVPGSAAAVPPQITQLTPHSYRKPAQLAPGGVLVVGASSTGIQLANEIQQAGHAVTLCVGEHVRMPRRYRGQDIMWWLHRLGLLDEGYREVDDITRARHVPSSQLVGTNDHSTLDLNTLSSQGVNLVGRLSGIRDGKAQFSGALHNVCKLADLKMQRLLNNIDEWIAANPADTFFTNQVQPAATRLAATPKLALNLASGEINTIIWACGFRPDYHWLQVPVLNHKGLIRHDGGITTAPGLYVMGLPFMRRRKSSLICGASDDARDISQHLGTYLRQLRNRSVI